MAFFFVAGAMDMHEPSGKSFLSAKGDEGASLACLGEEAAGMLPAPAADDAPSSTPDPALPIIVSLGLPCSVGCVWGRRGCLGLVYVDVEMEAKRPQKSVFPPRFRFVLSCLVLFL